MSGSNQPSDEEHVRELDVDEAFEHWSELAKRLGASQPVESWDVPPERPRPAPAFESDVHEPAELPPHVETDWNAVANSLGVSVSPKDLEWETAEASEFAEPEAMEDMMPRKYSPEDEEAAEEDSGARPDSLETVPEAWRSIWSDVKEPTAEKLRTPDEQAALDRLFGADSSRVFEPEPASRPEYFDIADEEEAAEEEETSEVRFVPREQSTLPPEESGTAEDRSRRHRRGRRGQSRRRGRRSDTRRSEEIEARESAPTEPDEYSRETEFVPDDEFDFEQELSRDEIASAAPAADLLEEENADTSGGPRRARHRKVASWKDAVGYIIDRNLANRDREPSDGNRRRRGGRRR